jgi:hypothetical protein
MNEALDRVWTLFEKRPERCFNQVNFLKVGSPRQVAVRLGALQARLFQPFGMPAVQNQLPGFRQLNGCLATDPDEEPVINV